MSEDSMVYFILSDSQEPLVKIGYSKNPLGRFKSIRTSSPLDLSLACTIPGDRKTEKEIHKIFSDKRVRGEWFSYCNEIEDFIKRLKTDYFQGYIGTSDVYFSNRIHGKSVRIGDVFENFSSNGKRFVRVIVSIKYRKQGTKKIGYMKYRVGEDKYIFEPNNGFSVKRVLRRKKWGVKTFFMENEIFQTINLFDEFDVDEINAYECKACHIEDNFKWIGSIFDGHGTTWIDEMFWRIECGLSLSSVSKRLGMSKSLLEKKERSGDVIDSHRYKSLGSMGFGQ